MGPGASESPRLGSPRREGSTPEGTTRSSTLIMAAKWSVKVQPGTLGPVCGDKSRALADGTCLGLNEAWLQVGGHEILHGIGNLVPTQAAENQQLLELVQVLIPDARQGLPATEPQSLTCGRALVPGTLPAGWSGRVECLEGAWLGPQKRCGHSCKEALGGSSGKAPCRPVPGVSCLHVPPLPCPGVQLTGGARDCQRWPGILRGAL